jgi:hypothetical protein
MIIRQLQSPKGIINIAIKSNHQERQMRKLFSRKVLIWVFSVLSVLIIGSLVIMNYATDYVLRSIIASSQEEITNEKSGNGSLPTTSPSAPNSGGTPQEGGSKNSDTASPSPSNQAVDPKKNDNGVQSPATTPPAANSAATPTPTPEKSGYDAGISAEKAAQLQEEITLKDKAKVSSVLLKKLSASDMSLFVKMSGDGVSVEEKKQAKAIILQKLTEEEYNELIAIAAKLGLSKGKTYQDSLK